MSKGIKTYIITDTYNRELCTIKLKESHCPVWDKNKKRLEQTYYVWKDNEIIIGTDTNDLTEAIETYNEIVDVYKELHSNNSDNK